MATDQRAAHPGAGWPFWAPSTDAAVERALDLAGVRGGDSFVDLGCGDGRVLVAAAARGASVVGVECDPALAADARTRLATANVAGHVVEADIFDLDLQAAVVFCYLSPATLQRLAPVLHRLPFGARLVTVDFAVPGVVPDRSAGGANLYVSPLRRCGPADPGWRSAGAFVVALPGYESLTCLDPAHPGGDVAVAVRGGLAGVVSVALGADRVARGDRLAVDLRWGEHDPGTVAWGRIEVTGLAPFPVFVLFADGDDGGAWELSPEACDRLADRLARHVTGASSPPTAADLIATANGES